MSGSNVKFPLDGFYNYIKGCLKRIASKTLIGSY